MFYKDARQTYRASAFDRLPWLDHGFGTRLAGDWVPGPLATARQIHSDICLVAGGAPGSVGEGDAVLSAEPGLWVGIRTADCVPVLVADERKRAVAAIHAGWRGTEARVAAKAVAALGERYGSDPQDLIAAIGPGICGRCYEVGPEVAARFRDLFPERQDLDARANLDLAEACRRQLVMAGVNADRIVSGAPCTFCTPEDFDSWRRDKEKAGRMISAIGIRP